MLYKVEKWSAGDFVFKFNAAYAISTGSVSRAISGDISVISVPMVVIRKMISRPPRPLPLFANRGKNDSLFKDQEPQKPYPIPRHIPI